MFPLIQNAEEKAYTYLFFILSKNGTRGEQILTVLDYTRFKFFDGSVTIAHSKKNYFLSGSLRYKKDDYDVIQKQKGKRITCKHSKFIVC